jgi:hypothetical protein
MAGSGVDPGEWRLEGEGARFLGLPQSANPYPLHSIGGEIWAAGWAEADEIVGLLMTGRSAPSVERPGPLAEAGRKPSDSSQG